MTGLVRLAVRREAKSDAFALRCLHNPDRFLDWFPPANTPRATRSTKPFKEEFARCSRLQKSPIFYMRKLLNEIYGS